MNNLSISLLHATYRAGPKAVAIQEAWLESAAHPGRVEYVFACDQDDEISLSVASIAAGVLGVPMTGKVTAVRNWNAAAESSNGDLLVVVADDLYPPQDWDSILEALCCDLDPNRAAFVIKVRDRQLDQRDSIKHPILSRRYFERFGLWCPEYDGWYVDDDFTLSAHRRNLVIDGRRLQLDHRHPSAGAPSSSSHDLIRETRERGKVIFDRRWPMWKRRLVRLPLRPRTDQQTIGIWSQLARSSLSRTGYIIALVPSPIRNLFKSAVEQRLRREGKARPQ